MPTRAQRRYGSGMGSPDNPLSMLDKTGEWNSAPQEVLRGAQDTAKQRADELHAVTLRRTLWGKAGKGNPNADAVSDDELKSAKDAYDDALARVGKANDYISKQPK